MSHFKTTYQDFIQNSFSPLVAVMCSPLVEGACKKNNLTFTELLQPFCKLNSEANFRDPSGTNVSLKNFRVSISDVNSRPPQPTMARKFLNESVSSHVYDKTTNTEINGLSLDVPAAVPWFEAWRDTFLQVQFPSDHEFTKHYLACMLAVSSAETNPLDMFVQMGSKLMQMQTISPAKLPKWFSPSVLRYYILLHDNVDGDTPLAESLFETMKTTYGASNVFFLNINSQPSQPPDSHLPDPWTQFLSKQIHSQENNEADVDKAYNHIEGSMAGSQTEVAQEAGETTPSTPTTTIMHPLSPISDAQSTASDKSTVDGMVSGGGGVSHGACLTAEDLDKLRELISCFCVSCLIPHVEQQIQHLTEVISNKKGMSRSFLSATKRWFGSNKPGVPNTPQPNISYTNDSTELQLRRLGDLCFMFGAYTLAFSAYHAAKREFSVDSAWLYYAGALEMAALSLYMQPSDPTRKAHDYAEESIVTYLNSCRMPQFAVRATLFSCECLCGRGQFGEAAKQLIRMTSEDSDLRSALLLEQAAYCFLASPRLLMPRKYAFHLVLAGHRFSKAGQKKHSLRCYRQAYQVYENKKWSLAEDHIHHTIGRQAAALKQLNQAAQAFALLLPRVSRQSPAQQSTFLREYLNTQQQLSSESGELPTLPLPVLDHDSIQVLLGQPPPPVSNPSVRTYATGISFDTQHDDVLRWNRMEEQLVSAVAVNQPIVFKPTVELLNNSTNNTTPPTTYVQEAISVSVSLGNPLHNAVTVSNLRLLWNYIPSNGGLCQDNSSKCSDSIAAPASSSVIPRLEMQPDSSCKVILQVTALQVGELRITGVLYQLEGERSEEVGGAGEAVSGRQLLFPRAKLRTIKDQSAGDNGLYAADNRLKFNIVKHAPHLRVSFEGLRKEMMSGELSEVKVNLENCGTLPVTRLLVVCSMPEVVSLGRRCTHFMDLPLDKPLAPDECTSVAMRVRAPHLRGSHTVHILFYYETSNNKTKPLYRLVRHSWPVLVHDSLQVSVTTCRSSVTREETLNLRLQVLNKSQTHDSVKSVMCVECAAIHSPHWQLCDRGCHPAAVPLGPQELAYFLLKVRRKREQDDGDLSALALTEGTTLAPSSDFLLQSEPSETLESIVALQATFIIMWKATMETRGGDMRVAVGQHHVSLSQLGSTDSWPLAAPPPAGGVASVLRIFGEGAVTETGVEQGAVADSLSTRQQLLTFSVLGQPGPAHDFTAHSVCIVPVELVLRNCSDCQLQVKVEAAGATVSSRSSAQCEGFRWVGATRRLLSVAPHMQTPVKLVVATGAPGTYDLSSHLTVLARRHADTEFTAQTWLTNATLVVS